MAVRGTTAIDFLVLILAVWIGMSSAMVLALDAALAAVEWLTMQSHSSGQHRLETQNGCAASWDGAQGGRIDPWERSRSIGPGSARASTPYLFHGFQELIRRWR
jgi:hypothetical protein